MTVDQWRYCAESGRMLHYLGEGASQRKLRLFACACSREQGNLYGLLSGLKANEYTRHALMVAEQYADGLGDGKELEAARARIPRGETPALWSGPIAALLAAVAGPTDDLHRAATQAAYGSVYATWQSGRTAPVISALLRDIFSPFSTPFLSPSILAWNGSTVVQLAQVIYNEKRFDHMPLLADALAEAGCSDPAVLEHCRETSYWDKIGREHWPILHTRGCWVIDAILGRS